MMNNTTTFLLLRFAIAASMLGHGLVRMPKLRAFSNWMVSSFEKSMLPLMVVRLFSYVLPITELVVGLLLFVGFLTATAAVAGGLLMILLILGSAVIEKWDALPSQLIHIAFFATVLYFIQYNTLALDNLF